MLKKAPRKKKLRQMPRSPEFQNDTTENSIHFRRCLDPPSMAIPTWNCCCNFSLVEAVADPTPHRCFQPCLTSSCFEMSRSISSFRFNLSCSFAFCLLSCFPAVPSAAFTKTRSVHLGVSAYLLGRRSSFPYANLTLQSQSGSPWIN